MNNYFILALLTVVPSLYAGSTKESAQLQKTNYALISEKKSPTITQLAIHKKGKKKGIILHGLQANNLEKKALMLTLDDSDVLLCKTTNAPRLPSEIKWSGKELLELDISQTAIVAFCRNQQVKKAQKNPSKKQKELKDLIEELIDGRPTTCITHANDPKFIIHVFEQIAPNEIETLRVLCKELYSKENKRFSTRCAEFRKKVIQKCAHSSKGYKPID